MYVASPRERTLPRLLTLQEVAEALNISPRTLERWSTEGRLPRVALGTRTIRYRAEDIERLIAAGEDPENGNTPVRETEALPQEEDRGADAARPSA